MVSMIGVLRPCAIAAQINPITRPWSVRAMNLLRRVRSAGGDRSTLASPHRNFILRMFYKLLKTLASQQERASAGSDSQVPFKTTQQKKRKTLLGLADSPSAGQSNYFTAEREMDR
jgi:hypothetical protein